MTYEAPLPAPIVADPGQAVQDAAALVPGPPHPPPMPTPEQAQAADAVFAAQEREQALVAGLLGMWTGTMLLNDLAKEHLSEPAGKVEEEKEEEERKKKR